jgi:hypothetical protein
MCPQLVDFDADGHMDLVAGTFDGAAFLVRGSERGYQPFERIRDVEGRQVQLSSFWNYETESWDDAERGPAGAPNPADHMISTAAVDWDGDGDLDLVLGAKKGRLYVQRNVGTRTEPVYSGVSEPILTSIGDVDASASAATQVRTGEHLTVPGGCTAPRVVDWNGDGLFDLVCGSFGGGVFAYLNRGTRQEPAFGVPIALLYNTVDRTPRGGAAHSGPERGTYADAVDYDGDGDLDLVVGGYLEITPEPRELTPDQEELVAELTSRIRALEKRIDEVARDGVIDEDGYLDEATNAAIQEILLELQPLQRQLDRLVPQIGERARVFFYERL